jgi:NAD kinase
MGSIPALPIITRETRLSGLLQRWGTRGAARFRMKLAHEHTQAKRLASSPNTITDAQAAAEFSQYEEEDRIYRDCLEQLKIELDLGMPLTFIDRSYLPGYDFRGCWAVVVVGQDGLVANAAKYVGNVPIIAVNPDPQRFDGVLLPFQIHQARTAVQRVLHQQANLRSITMAEAVLNDGQRLLAFNDLFVGCNGHASARYTLTAGSNVEPQSSSGMIISTGAGSTGWLSSLLNMYRGLGQWLGGTSEADVTLAWEDPRLAWVVREPFRSKQSGANLVAGMLEPGDALTIESLMPSRGVIFSDGVEADFLEFNSGTIAKIQRAAQVAQLVVE